MTAKAAQPDLRDDFPDSPARRAVVAVVRGFGAVQRQMGPYFAQFDLTPPQFQMLTVIHRLQDEPVSQRRLGRELYVSFPNITVMLSRMEAAKLIRRRANPLDRREKFVELTRRGESLLNRIWKVHQQQLEHVTAGVNSSEREQLTGLLNKLIFHHVPEESKMETTGVHSKT